MSGDATLYLWGAYTMGVVLVATELALLFLRSRAIRGHLGWKGGFPGDRRKSPARER